MKNQLIIPMAIYVFYIWFLAVYMFRTRVQSVKDKDVTFGYFRTYTGQFLKEKAIVVGRHYDNQFQVPVLFFMTCAVFIALDKINSITLILAWSFVVSRFYHAWIHLGSNDVRKRVVAFVIGWAMVLLLWVQIIYISLFNS